jgi:hypothetical protein
MLYPPVGSPSYAGNSVDFSRTANSAWPKLIRIGRLILDRSKARCVWTVGMPSVETALASQPRSHGLQPPA